MSTHTQCSLQHGNTHTTSWIPTKFAQVGAVVKLKDKSGWHDGWMVTHAGTTLPSETVMERRDDYKTQRRASDV